MKKLLALTLLFASCVGGKNTQSVNSREIVDGAGRTVTIPSEVPRMITIDRGFAPQVLKVLGKDNLLVATGGVHPKSGASPTKSDSFFLVPHLLDIPTVGWAGYGSYDFEKILEVDPEVIVMIAYDGLSENGYQKELVERLENEFKIPVVILRDYTAETNLASLDTYYENIKLLGQVTGATNEADELVNKLDKQIQKAKSFISKDHSKTMLFLGVTDRESGAGYVHGQDFGGAALTTTLLNIKNAYTNADMPVLGTEHILELNPDMIVMLDAPASKDAVELYTTNPIFQNINAVKNNQVYFTGQLQWWGDAKLMFPLQMLLYSAIYYQPEGKTFKGIYTDYITDIFGILPEKVDQLKTIHRLDSLFEE